MGSVGLVGVAPREQAKSLGVFEPRESGGQRGKVTEGLKVGCGSSGSNVPWGLCKCWSRVVAGTQEARPALSPTHWSLVAPITIDEVGWYHFLILCLQCC